MNRRDIYEAAAFYRSAALCGETVTGDEYAEAFATKPQPTVPDPASLSQTEPPSEGYGQDWTPEEQAQMDQIDQRVYELYGFEVPS